MILMKRLNAFDHLSEIASEKWDDLGTLVKHILDNNLEDRFDNYICEEFPNGVEDWEFEEFCVENKKEILDNL